MKSSFHETKFNLKGMLVVKVHGFEEDTKDAAELVNGYVRVLLHRIVVVVIVRVPNTKVTGLGRTFGRDLPISIQVDIIKAHTHTPCDRGILVSNSTRNNKESALMELQSSSHCFRYAAVISAIRRVHVTAQTVFEVVTLR